MEKKKLSVKAKVLIIIGSVLAFLLLAVSGVAIYALNTYCAPIQVGNTVVSDNNDVRIIAHRGFSAIAPENTIPAVEEAGKAGFWGAETDIYRTTDGKWVMMHDNYLYRLMDGSKTKKVDSMTYDELMEYTYTNGANIDKYPNLKVGTLEEYLDTCKKYDMTPVIEYKSNKNYEYLHEVVEIIRSKGMENDCVVISFQLDALKKFQEASDVMPLWYLVQEVNEETINEAVSLGENAAINFNANNGKTTREMVNLAKEKGLDVCCWTIDKLDVMKEMVSWGVNTITTNAITPKKD